MKILLTAGYLIIVCSYAFDRVRKLRGGNEKREAWVYAVFMAVSAVAGALLLAGVEVPTLVLPYQILLEPIGKMILSD
ncbi:hypothetical protein GE107_24125 [Cohnella sp. CFH 77786]|uniref:hypothetical protein n=1 Tax=Cohnella sp. CFH 77786 TaxID=2662265 RepID=UPI001C60EA1A|nr:hypothetical protein [Cohnella sp. CFH 77786]MBW5449121.1 hypothetical protein [Cohnella sp. CFH 77786]